MKVLLLSANSEQINMPVMPLGLACVAEAVKRAGHDARLLDLMFVPEPKAALAECLAEFRPECIGISVRNIDDQNMDSPRFLLDEVKGVVGVCKHLSDAPIVLGGAGYSIFPESTLNYVEADMGLEGEGETAFPQLLSCLEQGLAPADIPGLIMRGQGYAAARTFSAGLAGMGLPGKNILGGPASVYPDPWIPVQTRRGCAMGCDYCSTPHIEGTGLRKRPPEYVVDWLEDWAKAGYSDFFFVDNTFNLPPAYAKALCRQIIDRNLAIRWQGIIYPKNVDEELVRLMAEAGCVHISLGFESGSMDVLQHMNKRFTPEEVREISALFAGHGIERMGFLLLGGPGETRETVEESLAFADSLDLELLGLTVGIRIYPHTPLAKTAVQQGIVEAEDDLLQPRFYVAPGLETWLPEHVKQWSASRSNIVT